MAFSQIGFVGQGGGVSEVVIGAPSTGYALRVVIDDTYAPSNAEVFRAFKVIERAIEQDTFPSSSEVSLITQYGAINGAAYETLVIGAVGQVNYTVRVIVDRSGGVTDPITSKSRVLAMLEALEGVLSTYKYPYS